MLLTQLIFCIFLNNKKKLSNIFLRKFLEETLICTDKNFLINIVKERFIPNTQTRHHFDLVEDNITNLLSGNKNHFVQTFGYDSRGAHFSSTKLNLINRNLMTSEFFEKLLEILGEEIINMMLYNFYVLLFFTIF